MGSSGLWASGKAVRKYVLDGNVQFPSAVSKLGSSLADMEMANLQEE